MLLHPKANLADQEIVFTGFAKLFAVISSNAWVMAFAVNSCLLPCKAFTAIALPSFVYDLSLSVRLDLKKDFCWNYLYRFRKAFAVIASNGFCCEQLFFYLVKLSQRLPLVYVWFKCEVGLTKGLLLKLSLQVSQSFCGDCQWWLLLWWTVVFYLVKLSQRLPCPRLCMIQVWGWT